MTSEDGGDYERQPEQQASTGQPSTSAPTLSAGKLIPRVHNAFLDFAESGTLPTQRLEELLSSLDLSISREVYAPVLNSVAGSSATHLTLDQT